MRVGLVTQPPDGVLPPRQNSIFRTYPIPFFASIFDSSTANMRESWSSAESKTSP